MQEIRKYVRQHHPKRPTKDDSMVSKKVSISKETKKEQKKKSYQIKFDQEILVRLFEMMIYIFLFRR